MQYFYIEKIQGTSWQELGVVLGIAPLFHLCSSMRLLSLVLNQLPLQNIVDY